MNRKQLGIQKIQAWKDAYEIGKELEGGGQGKVYTVRQKGSEGSFDLVLKEPKDRRNDRNYQTRKRMRQEIESLRKLSQSKDKFHPGVVKLVDDNANMSEDTRIQLFMVTELVHGETLDRIAPRDLIGAIHLVLSLLDALEFCHDNKVIHRDIKPKNIKLGTDGIPILLDFGLSCDQDNVGDHTAPGEPLGNQFIVLPELKIRGGKAQDKRDERSDICMCVGIFFYLITKIEPEHLLDSNNRTPHRRSPAKERLAKAADSKLPPLNNLFDRGFQMEIGKRFQTIPELREALNNILIYEPLISNTAILPDVLKNLRDTERGTELSIRRAALDHVQQAIKVARQEKYEEFFDDFTVTEKDSYMNLDEPAYSVYVEFQHKTRGALKVKTKFVARIVASEVVLVGNTNGRIDEVLRFELSTEPNEAWIAVCEYIDQQILEACKKESDTN